jgi:myo-inositol-1(or 4)-monophosphatase
VVETSRLEFAKSLALEAGAFAKSHFLAIDGLQIESKGHQDLVSNADKDTETLIRDAIEAHWPDDGIVGEEHGRKHGTSGYDWVIDPIDGTANFVRGIPQWCVVIACAKHGDTVVGVINEPVSGELFHAVKGGGAFCNDRPLRVFPGEGIGNGAIGTGFSGRVNVGNIVKLIDLIVNDGGVFFRNASGALSLAYAAAGRLLGYVEEHMNSWDCVAGLLMVEEAGGMIMKPDPQTVLEQGTIVLAGGPGVYPLIRQLAKDSYGR